MSITYSIYDLGLEYLLKSKVYSSKEELVEDAIRNLILTKPEYRIDIAVNAYNDDKISLGKASEIAGITQEEMKQLLLQRGIKLRLGPKSKKEIEEEIQALEGL